MIKKNEKGDIVFANYAEQTQEVKDLKLTRNKEWVNKAIRYAYFMWSEDTSEVYGNLLPSKKSQRVCKDFLDGFDFNEIIKEPAYKKFEQAYIETQYTPEWAVYLAWQKDADQFIKLNSQEDLTIENRAAKFDLMKKAKEILQLGKEIANIAKKESKFKYEKGDVEARLFENPE